MGKVEVAPAGLRLRAVRDGPALKPLKETTDVVVDKAEEVVEEVVRGVKLLLWTDLRELLPRCLRLRFWLTVAKRSGSGELIVCCDEKALVLTFVGRFREGNHYIETGYRFVFS